MFLFKALIFISGSKLLEFYINSPWLQCNKYITDYLTLMCSHLYNNAQYVRTTISVNNNLAVYKIINHKFPANSIKHQIQIILISHVTLLYTNCHNLNIVQMSRHIYVIYKHSCLIQKNSKKYQNDAWVK